MGIFKQKSELEKQIAHLERKNQRLISDQELYISKIAALENKLDILENENENIRKKYIDTGLECPECYCALQESFRICPNCGNKIVYRKLSIEPVPTDIFKIEMDGNECIITGYIGFSDKKLTIPSMISGKPVVGIWNDVFEKCVHVEEVIFEEGCKYIGDGAFCSCTNLKRVKLPKSLLEIGDAAFGGDTSLNEIIVPVNVKKIGNGAFAGCSNLSKVILPAGIEVIARRMFYNTAISEIDIPDSVMVLGSDAFYKTNLVKVCLPEQLRIICRNAFENCKNLQEIVMHSNIEILDEGIFNGCNPIIQCSAGSKAQKYARSSGMQCNEIPAAERKDNRSVGVQWIDLERDALHWIENGRTVYSYFTFGRWLNAIGGGKAKGYAYDIKTTSGIKDKMQLDSYYTYEEALRLKTELQTKGIRVNLFDFWGKSVV